MKHTLSPLIKCTALLTASLALHFTSPAQTTAIWTGPASGGEWNTAANWSTGRAPADLTTNAFIGVGTNVNYNVPMTAGSIGAMTNYGLVTINTSGFVVGASGNAAVNAGGVGVRVLINTGGVLSITNGGLTLTNSAALVVSNGGVFTASGTLMVGAGSGNGTTDKVGIVTNNSGIISVAGVRISPNNGNANSRVVINGGTNDLGDIVIQRSNLTTWAVPGAEGLLIYGGVVRVNSVDVGSTGADATATMLVANGAVTNAGAFTIRQKTAARPSRFMQTGGYFVSTNNDGIHLRGQPANNAIVGYSVTGGTNIVSGFLAADPGDVAGTLNFTNAANIYVGGAGFSNNTMTAINVALNAGGTFGATADWTATVPMILGGSFTFNAADLDGTAHNITLNGVLNNNGSATLNKTGAGTLTFNNTNPYLSDTLINAGSLVLGATGSIANSAHITLGAGTLFDVSAVSGGFVLSAGKILGGFGVVTGDVAVASTGIIDPGTNSATGTLSFSNSVTQTGGAKNHFDLSTNPSGPNNDLIVINGNLNVSGISNLVEISGGGPSGSVHPLFKYYGTFNGDLTNFVVVGPNGVLTNITSTTPKMIAFRAVTTVRGPTNVVWAGNATLNDWDALNLTNWVNNGALDFFVAGDNAIFNAVGAANPNVNLPGTVTPASVTVNAATDYVIAGAGSIGGGASLTKTNAGRLTVLNTNNFTGGVNIKGGVLSMENVADDGIASPLGLTGTILVDGGTLEYSGPNNTWTRTITMGASGGSVSVSNAATALTHSGTVIGAGLLNKIGAGNLILNNSANSYGGTVLNAGVLTLNNAGAAGAGVITLNAGNLVLGAVKPANTINVAASGLITGGNAGGATGIRNITGSADLLLAVTTGVFDLTGDMTAYSGTITFTNTGGAIVRFNGSIGSPLATWNLGAGPMDLNVRTGSTSNTIGALKGAAGTTLSGRGGSGNNGATTHFIGANGLSTTFDGIIQNGSGGGSSSTAMTKVGAGTLTLSGANPYTGATAINNGVLALTGSGSIASSSSINVVAGAALDVSGLATPTLVVGGSQTLQGRGTILGGVDSTTGLRIAPGGGVGGGLGTLTATNAITLGGTTWMKLNRASTPNADKLVSSLSTITYGGTLLVTNIGAALQVGDTFDLFDGAGLGAATFATLQLPNYITWNTSNLGVNGTLSVTGFLPGPTISSIANDGVNVTIAAGGGAANGPYTLLSSTNVALPISSWTTVTTGTFDGTGALNPPLTVPVDPAAKQQFYLLQVQ